MNNFSAPADGISVEFDCASSPQEGHGRVYPSLDSLINSDSFDEIESDQSISAPSTPPLTRKYLYPKKEFVDKLQPEEVRWFYKKDGDKKWTAFIGYDSLRIECRYRVQLYEVSEDEAAALDVILVRGGLYEVDVSNYLCRPVYWSGDTYTILRGTWFYDGSWQPVEEGYAKQIETEYLGKFLGKRIDESPTLTDKGQKIALLNIRFKEFYLEWYTPRDVFLFSESTSSRFFRAVGSKLGVQHSGSRLHRGFCYEAVMEDKPADISHLVFVVHGIGQKMDSSHIVRCTQEMRERVHHVKNKLFPNFEHQMNERAEFLPVEWRSSLKLDGDTVETLTPQRMRGIRNMLNASAMDILYYTSPLYRAEITKSLELELNRLYDMFCERHPYFEPNGGKVSVVAHSLGSVITYDILCGWNPITLYDQFVSSVIEEEKEQAAGSSELLEELEQAKKRVTELESCLKTVRDKQHKEQNPLKFKVENLFCVGSPLGVFLALRGIRPQGKGTLDHIVTENSCKRLFNIYHPTDPVAYRLEPLVLKHYSTIKPLEIYRYDFQNKIPYVKMKSQAFKAFQLYCVASALIHAFLESPITVLHAIFFQCHWLLGSSEVLDEKSDTSDKDSVDSGSVASKDGSPARKKISFGKVNKQVGGWFNSFTKSMNMDDDTMSAELKMFNKMQKEAELIEKSALTQQASTQPEDIDQTDLEYRLDYQLRDGGGITGGYISMVTSHTSYWSNKDIACFLLTHLHHSLQ